MLEVTLEPMDMNKVLIFFLVQARVSVSWLRKIVALTIFFHNRLQDHEAVLDLYLS